jgi:hypothetical protein
MYELLPTQTAALAPGRDAFHFGQHQLGLYSFVIMPKYNPVAAGLVGKPEEWRWSSAYKLVELQT